MKFELRNHPAQARHPVTKAPLFDEDGAPVPLFPEMKAVYLDGFLMGYCGKGPVNLIRPVDEYVRGKIEDFVRSELGDVSAVSMPPVIEEEDEEE